MRRAARVDDNHAEIVDGLRKFGIFAHSTAALGNGFVDVVAGRDGWGWRLLEIKSGKGKLSDKEREFHEACAARGLPVDVVRSLEEALAVFGIRVRNG